MVDAHTLATYAFAQMRRDPEFNNRLPWVRNTVVCVESDLVDDVLVGQVQHYFPQGATIACYYPDEKRFMFIWVKAPRHTEPGDSDADGGDDEDMIVARDKHRALTIGMMVDTIYRHREGDYSDLPVWGRQRLMAEASTVEVERTLALS